MNPRKVELMSVRVLVLCLGFLLAAGYSCRSRRAPPNARPEQPSATPAAVEKAPAPVAPSGSKAPEPGSAITAEPKAAAEPAATGAAKAKPDKNELWKCYQEVYCAQKKGEMEKILDIYKKYGFETPQEFTRIWIEAAKDTDWVSKLANDVSKKCR